MRGNGLRLRSRPVRKTPLKRGWQMLL